MTDNLLTPPEPKVKVTTEVIKAAMRKTWCGPENALVWEVALATGAVARQRYADALIMSLWPSRGLELHGVEIKVSRADWKREAANPEKAEAIAAYCDRWWVHVAPGVIHDLAEVPMTWGVREYNGTRWKTLREATKTDALPMDRAFLASIMRRSVEGVEAIAAMQMAGRIEAQRKEFDARVAQGIKQATDRKAGAQSALDRIEAALGLKITTDYDYGGVDPTELGALIKAIVQTGLASQYGGLFSLRHNAENIGRLAAQAVKAIDEAGAAIAPLADAIKAAQDEAEEQRKAARRR
jgi:hypothetical protein